mmetsp:Transcript_19490/g.62596  ORF Transcript_19490/g.62596 Transcript_19490/m.62596 type:complete len:247 (+) Transcript_19490:252-992(+)
MCVCFFLGFGVAEAALGGAALESEGAVFAFDEAAFLELPDPLAVFVGIAGLVPAVAVGTIVADEGVAGRAGGRAGFEGVAVVVAEALAAGFGAQGHEGAVPVGVLALDEPGVVVNAGPRGVAGAAGAGAGFVGGCAVVSADAVAARLPEFGDPVAVLVGFVPLMPAGVVLAVAAVAVADAQSEDAEEVISVFVEPGPLVGRRQENAGKRLGLDVSDDVRVREIEAVLLVLVFGEIPRGNEEEVRQI